MSPGSPVSQSRPRVVLIGPPASGKSKIGKRIARLLGCDFVDTDKVIEATHGVIADIFAEHGEPYFREREREVVSEALSGSGVVSLGGGAVVTPGTREELADHRVVQFIISEDAVSHRVADSPKRPLLAGGLDAWKKLVAARQGWYDECSSVSVDVSHRDPDDVAREVLAWLTQEESDD